MWRVSRTIERPGESMSTMKTLRAAARALLGIGRRHQLQKIGALGVRDEALVAVDDIVIALADGARLHAAGIAAGLRLGLREGRRLLAAQQRIEIALLHLLRQPQQDRARRWAEHAVAAIGQRDRAMHLLPHHRERQQATGPGRRTRPAYRAATAPARAPWPPAMVLISGLRSGPSMLCISIGINSRSTNLRTVSRNSRMSSGNSKSMQSPPTRHALDC